MNDRPDGDEPTTSEELIRRAREGLAPSADTGDSSAESHEDAPPGEQEATGPTSDVPAASRPKEGEVAPSPRDEPQAGSERSEREGDGPPEAPPRSVRARLWSVARWVVAALILFAFLGRFFDSGSGLDELAIGDCFEDPGFGEVSEVEVVDCDELHDFELYSLVDLGPSSRAFPGEDALLSELELECSDDFTSYVGTDYATSAYDFVSFTPVEQGWESGDRTGMCALYQLDPDGFGIARSIGSAGGSAR